MSPDYDIPHIIEFLNLCARELSNINHLPLVRYEGMPVQPEN